MQQLMKKIIAFQGSKGANSNLACEKFYPEFEAQAFSGFVDVFQAVSSGKVEMGMIPLENSSAGRVSEIHELLQEYNVSIIAEHFVEIEHCLASVKGATIQDIKKVYSHPQALMQCKNNLRELGVEACESSNTAEAAKFVFSTQNKSKAALCSKVAAQVNGLEIIKEKMQDLQNNSTLFIVISQHKPEVNSEVLPVITSIIFTIKNYPGSLYKAIGSFATNSVGMMQIESFIRGGASKQAAFFVIIEGHENQQNVSQALKELEFFAKDVKVLGSYYADKSRFQCA
jgi:prephenate dehydratase